MVNFTTPNLPGASDIYNKIASKVDSIEKDVMSKLEGEASVLASSLSTDLMDLKVKTGDMIPELPSLPAVNLQSEITSLAALSPESGEYTVKIASITTSFGSAISAGGYNLDSIVSDGISSLAGATGSLAAAIPNMELPEGATEAIELAKASLLPDKDAVKEAASTFSTDETVDELKGIFGDAFATNTFDASVAALDIAANTAVNTFNSRDERLAKELKEVRVLARRV
jgi:hypothetical protein